MTAAGRNGVAGGAALSGGRGAWLGGSNCLARVPSVRRHRVDNDGRRGVWPRHVRRFLDWHRRTSVTCRRPFEDDVFDNLNFFFSISLVCKFFFLGGGREFVFLPSYSGQLAIFF